ncbi:hypothetical protein LCGC14_1456810, partial [marine sediment metagenome]
EKCGNNGVIKHKWKVSVTLEDGELPGVCDYEKEWLSKLPPHGDLRQKWQDDLMSQRLALIRTAEATQQDMLNARYRQVVE